jgi:hypothetical protein
MLHWPAQQSLPLRHVSPVCWQKEPAWQVPSLAQNWEQHWALVVHASPTPPQPVVMDAHVPDDEQRPLQH